MVRVLERKDIKFNGSSLIIDQLISGEVVIEDPEEIIMAICVGGIVSELNVPASIAYEIIVGQKEVEYQSKVCNFFKINSSEYCDMISYVKKVLEEKDILHVQH